MKLKLLLVVLFLWNLGKAQTQTVTYTEHNNEFANPERGIYHYTEAQSNNYVALNQSVLENWRNNDNITMIKLRMFLLNNKNIFVIYLIYK